MNFAKLEKGKNFEKWFIESNLVFVSILYFFLQVIAVAVYTMFFDKLFLIGKVLGGVVVAGYSFYLNFVSFPRLMELNFRRKENE